MPKPNDQPSASDGNLLLVVCLLVVFAGMASVTCAYTAGYVLDEINSRDFMVMLVTDKGLQSDNEKLTRNLSSATLALQSVRDLGLALSFGCLGVAVAAGFRVWRGRRQG
jgi:hypothetical protein